MTLKLGVKVSIPDDAITETFGILAARGAGKSNTAAVMAEEMYRADLPFVVVDPVGSWWGLRSSKSGKGPGIEIALFGGKRGDVPLERTGGNLIADIVVDDRLSCILDLTDFDSEAAKKQFLLDFARRLYQRNELPLHLFLEEADDYIPQKPMRDEAQMLRAWENIVRRGRARGLGMTMITQRSASINKNVLTQVQTLIAMRTTGPQDRKAIEEWVKYNDQSKDILSSLSGLRDGEAWIWSPQFLKKTLKVQFRRRRTFDSGSTPKMAEKSKTARLADVDVSKLRQQMAETVKRAEANDPKILRKTIARLERELAGASKRAGDPADKERIVELETQIDARTAVADIALSKLSKMLRRLNTLVQDLDKMPELVEDPPPRPVQRPPVRQVKAAPLKQEAKPDKIIDGISGPQQRILDAIARMESVRVSQPPKTVIASVAGCSPRSSAYTNNLGRLRSLGLIDYGPGKSAFLTESGKAAASWPTDDYSLDQYHHSWRSIISGPQAAIMDVCIKIYPDAREKEWIAAEAGVSATSSAFTNNLGRLRTLGLIDYPSPGQVCGTELLFPGDLQ